MKLKYAKATMRQKISKIYIIIATIFITCVFISCVIKIGFSDMMSVYCLCACIVLFLIVIGVFSKITDKLNKDYKYLKENGNVEKTLGNIVGVGKINNGIYRKNYYIIVEYDGLITRINFLEANEAFSILEMLLDSYPVKEQKKIPIGLYVHKNKVYADLETVDLSKVEGYEEAVKLVEDMKDDMGMKENIKDYLF